jgi:RNA-splicing ligase RtcB
MIKMKMTKGKSPVLVWTDDVESSAHDQLARMANLSIVHSHIAVMPDVHMGKGATVGSVIPTREAIIPAAVGVCRNHCVSCVTRSNATFRSVSTCTATAVHASRRLPRSNPD